MLQALQIDERSGNQMSEDRMSVDDAFALGVKVGRVGAELKVDADYLKYVVRENWDDVVRAARSGDSALAKVLRETVPAKFRAEPEPQTDIPADNPYDRIRSEMRAEQKAREEATQNYGSGAKRLGAL
jgi:hypothetical protein